MLTHFNDTCFYILNNQQVSKTVSFVDICKSGYDFCPPPLWRSGKKKKDF